MDSGLDDYRSGIASIEVVVYIGGCWRRFQIWVMSLRGSSVEIAVLAIRKERLAQSGQHPSLLPRSGAHFSIPGPAVSARSGRPRSD